MSQSYRDRLRARAENLERPPKIERFYLYRKEDESGVSGTGVVAVGVRFPSGRCILEWVSTQADSSLGVYDSLEGVEQVHGHGGRTEVRRYADR